MPYPISAVRSKGSPALTPWWAIGGLGALCTRAYQPIGASSLATSYVNLANPGTGDASLGVAPTFATATGWTFNGSSQYLKTGLIIADTNVSVFVFIAGAASDAGSIFGFADSGGKVLDMNFVFNNDNFTDFHNAGLRRVSTTGITSSVVFGIAGKTAYVNGVADGTAIGAGSYTSPIESYIGCLNNNGTPQTYFNKTIKAIAFYNSVISPTQVSSLSGAMAALNP